MGDRPGHIGTTDTDGSGTSTLSLNQLLQDRNGNVWQVVQIGGGTTAPRFGLRSLSGIQSPSPDGNWSLFGAIRTGVGDDIFLTESGTAIRLSPDGTFAAFGRGESTDLFPDVGGGGGGGGGGAGAGAPSFASTQAGAEFDVQAAKEAAVQAAKVAEEAAAARRRFDEEQAELDRLRADRQSRLNIARDVIAEKEASARQARTQGTQLAGEDLFRFLAVSRGLQPPTGTTPTAAFKQNLLSAAQFQAPSLTQFTGGETAGQLGVDINALTSVLAKLQGTPDLPTAGPFGFAHGGTLDRSGVLGGTTQPGDGTVAIDVGEPINGQPNPEIVILRPDGSVEVVRKAGSARHGGVFDFGGGFRPSPTSRTTPQTGVIPQTGFDLGGLAPLFQRLRTATGIQPLSSFSSLSDLDASPEAQFRSQFGFLGLPGATQETSASFQASGGPISNIFQGQKEALEFQFLQAGLPAAQAAAQAASEARRISGLIGRLPAPHKIPPAFFNSLTPDEQNALISGYRLAGVPEASFTAFRTATSLPANPIRATAVG